MPIFFKLESLVVFKSLFLIAVMFVASVEAQVKTKTTGPNYGSCGPKPNMFSRLISDADKMREKCINDVYQEYLEARDKEVRELHEYSKYLESEVKKVAVKVTMILVDCGVETKRNPQFVLKCRQLNAERNAVISRIDRLMGWDESFRTAASENVAAKDLPSPPCPSSTEMERIKGIRYYNKRLYQAWERCMVLNQ